MDYKIFIQNLIKKYFKKQPEIKKNKLVILEQKQVDKLIFKKAIYTCVLFKIKKNDNKQNWKFYFRGTHKNRITIIVPFHRLPKLDYKLKEVYTIAVEINKLEQ